MCAREPLSPWWFVAFYFLLVCFAPPTSWGQEANAPEPTLSLPIFGQATPSIETPPTDPWANFDSAWTSLKDELIQSAEDSEKLSTLLLGLQIEVEELRSSLAESTRQFELSEANRMIEREAAEAKVTDAILKGIKAAKSRDRWKTAAIVEFIIASGLGIGLGLSLIF